MSYYNINISGAEIGNELSSDTDLAYSVLSGLAYSLEGDNSKFVEKLFKNIFEEEDSDLLNLLEEIVVSFKHLKENIND